jgi:hypothetical protein
LWLATASRPEGELFGVADLTVGPDGNLYVLPYGYAGVNMFSPAGAFLEFVPPSAFFSIEGLLQERLSVSASGLVRTTARGIVSHTGEGPIGGSGGVFDVAFLPDGRLAAAGANYYIHLVGEELFPVPTPKAVLFPILLWEVFGSFDFIARHTYVAPDGPGSPEGLPGADFEECRDVVADGAGEVTWTGGPFWSGGGTEQRQIGHYDSALTKLWTQVGAFSGPLGCNAGGRLACAMSGDFLSDSQPPGQQRLPSLAVLTSDGALEWAHFHHGVSSVAVAPDGWVATAGGSGRLRTREWDFLDALLGS